MRDEVIKFSSEVEPENRYQRLGYLMAGLALATGIGFGMGEREQEQPAVGAAETTAAPGNLDAADAFDSEITLFRENTQLKPQASVEAPPISPEVQPRQVIGTMKVAISGRGAMQPEVTHTVRAGDEHVNVTPVLDQGFGFHQDTAWPGEKGTTIIGGHRVTRINDGQVVLYDIDKIQTAQEGRPGDRLTLTLAPELGGKTLEYEATRQWIVDVNDPVATNEVFAQEAGRSILRIYACHPKYHDNQRFIVEYQQLPNS